MERNDHGAVSGAFSGAMGVTGSEMTIRSSREGSAVLKEKYWFEVYAAALKLVQELLKVRPGETVAVTLDTESDLAVGNAIAAAASSVGGKPYVFVCPAPRGVGKAADPDLPLGALSAALAESDVWVELNNQWLLYSSAYEKAIGAGKVRHLCLVGMDADMLVRTIGRVSMERYLPFWNKVAELTKQCKEMRITTPAGTDVRFANAPATKVGVSTGVTDGPGPHFLGGQIDWVPDLDSIEGTIVFDGALTPPVGLVREPVVLKVEKGRITDITGGSSASKFLKWLEELEDAHMYRLAHVCYGLNPGAVLTGNILEDERVWGCTEWGIGYLSPNPVVPSGIPAKSHCDGICLNSTVEGDVGTILETGKPVHPELVALLQ